MGRNGRGRSKDHVAANDNGANEVRVRSSVLTISRLLERQIAREQFERQVSANDNTPVRETDWCDDMIRAALYCTLFTRSATIPSPRPWPGASSARPNATPSTRRRAVNPELRRRGPDRRYLPAKSHLFEIANAIIALRCAVESNRFDDFWEHRAGTRPGAVQ